MRLVLAALGIYGLYRLLRARKRRDGPHGLLQDMRRRTDRRRAKGPDGGAPHVTYEVVEHDGGWAYKVGDVFSESYATREEAAKAASSAAAAHQDAGSDEVIQYQDADGRWHEEVESGEDRPATDVEVGTAGRA